MIKLVLVSILAACATNSQVAVPDADVDATDASIDAGVDAPLQPPQRKLVVIFGQSNARGLGLVSELADPTLADPYPAVPYVMTIGNDANPPATLSYPVGDLGPRIDRGGANRFGIELTLGRTLDEAEPNQWAIAKFAFDSTALAGEWSPTGLYPTGQPNLFTQSMAFIKQAEIDTGSTLGAMVWEQGESDAGSVSVGQTYGVRLAEFVGAVRYNLPTVPFIFGRLNVGCQAAGTQVVRDGQALVPASAPNVIMVDQDPYPLRTDDHTHYTSASLVQLGGVFADAVLNAEAL